MPLIPRIFLICVFSFLFNVSKQMQSKQMQQSVNETGSNLQPNMNGSQYDAVIVDKDDLAIYEMDNLEQHLQNARIKNNFYETKMKNSLRYREPVWNDLIREDYVHLSNLSLSLIQQSVYATRDRLQETRKYRQIFANDPPYRAALMYASLLQLRVKMENIHTTMRKLPSKEHFMHVLILYERMIIAKADVDSFVEQMFEIQEMYKKIEAGKPLNEQ